MAIYNDIELKACLIDTIESLEVMVWVAAKGIVIAKHGANTHSVCS